MKLRNPYGKVAIEVTSVKAEGDVIVIKGEALGSMPITVNVTADDMWEARHFMTWSVMRRAPVLFFRGWRNARRSADRSKPMEKPA